MDLERRYLNICKPKRLSKKDKKIIGYGATAKSCTVLNFCKIKEGIISFFYDTTFRQFYQSSGIFIGDLVFKFISTDA